MEFREADCMLLHDRHNAMGVLRAEHLPTGIKIDFGGRLLDPKRALSELEALVTDQDTLLERGRTRDELKAWMTTGRR